MQRLKPIIITPGEPAGIGPDILVKLAGHKFPIPVVGIADKNMLEQRAAGLDLKIDLPEYQAEAPAPFSIIHQPLAEICQPGQPNVANSGCALSALDLAIDGCLNGEFSALVTGPINKALINQHGINFNGHTDYLAEKSGVEKAVMLFTLGEKRLALVTTHIPLAEVPAAITEENLTVTIHIINHALQNLFQIKHPKLLITGLNPHAGEQGCIGGEEINIIEPTLNKLRQQNIDIIGPVSADTVFKWAEKNPVDVIITLFHDQGLPVFKTLGFGKLVNVTLGLPFIRTSVDHGSAFDLAGNKNADESSLVSAVQLAIKLTEPL